MAPIILIAVYIALKFLAAFVIERANIAPGRTGIIEGFEEVVEVPEECFSPLPDEDPDDTVLLWPCKLFLFPLCLHPLRFQALYMGLALYMITTSFSY